MKYRIVTDKYAGFEVQKKRWWWLWWVQLNGVNTNCSIEHAKKVIERDKLNGGKPTVVYQE